jgi:hypothetical protein
MTVQRMQKLHRLPEVRRTDQIEEKIFRISFTFSIMYLHGNKVQNSNGWASFFNLYYIWKI